MLQSSDCVGVVFQFFIQRSVQVQSGGEKTFSGGFYFKERQTSTMDVLPAHIPAVALEQKNEVVTLIQIPFFRAMHAILFNAHFFLKKEA